MKNYPDRILSHNTTLWYLTIHQSPLMHLILMVLNKKIWTRTHQPKWVTILCKLMRNIKPNKSQSDQVLWASMLMVKVPLIITKVKTGQIKLTILNFLIHSNPSINNILILIVIKCPMKTNMRKKGFLYLTNKVTK